VLATPNVTQPPKFDFGHGPEKLEFSPAGYASHIPT
jgi:hypothetical protein